MNYIVQRVAEAPSLGAAWDDPVWESARTGAVDGFHVRSADHRPDVRFRMVHNDQGLHLIFRVDDQYVRAVHTEYQDPVCTDSCVEFFVQPLGIGGYFNFETNCIGTKHISFIENHRRLDEGFAQWEPLSPELGQRVEVATSLSGPIDPEISEPLCWTLQMRIPVALFEAYFGPLGPLSGQSWRANFYKCGDHTSRPHWASWAPIGSELNFHQPERFGGIHFA